MAVPGTKPKADRTQVRHRNTSAVEWTEVPNVPFEDGPPLPSRHTFRDDGEEITGWPTPTREWWDALRRMPHAKLWNATDWRYAFDVAEAHARFYEAWRGCAPGTELRNREKALGLTMDARRDLRIRYVDPPPASTGPPADVVQLDDYRAL